MTKTVLFSLGAFLLVSCASKSTSSADARAELEKKYTPQVGKATKAELVEEFGTPEWCRNSEDGSTETCRFYKKKGTKWLGDKKDRKHYEAYDEIVADFDSLGVLKQFKASSQR